MKSKITHWFPLFLFVGLLLTITTSCKKPNNDMVGSLPDVTTSNINIIEPNNAQCGGDVVADGGSFITRRGVCWGRGIEPTINDSITKDGNGAGPFNSIITSLTPNTNYYVRAYAINENGVSYGKTLSFITTTSIVTTVKIDSIMINTAFCKGSVDNTSGFKITERGFCWSKSMHPTINDEVVISYFNSNTFSCWILGLLPNTKYYVRAYASNTTETVYGSSVSFTTMAPTIKDIDNNEYKIVQIGTQIWMAENLKTSKYANGEEITLVNSTNNWSSLNAVSKCYCYYNDSIQYANVYGFLYSWAAAMNGAKSSSTIPSNVQGACPNGWHIPSGAEWGNLITFLGDDTIAANKLKEAGNSHWLKPSNASNETGFTMLPGGTRSNYGYSGIYQYANVWTSTELAIPNDVQGAFYKTSYFGSSEFGTLPGNKRSGFSVRCVKD